MTLNVEIEGSPFICDFNGLTIIPSKHTLVTNVVTNHRNLPFRIHRPRCFHHAVSELARARRAWTAADAVSKMAPRADGARRERGRITGAIQNSARVLSDLHAFDLHLGAC